MRGILSEAVSCIEGESDISDETQKASSPKTASGTNKRKKAEYSLEFDAELLNFSQTLLRRPLSSILRKQKKAEGHFL